MPRYGTTPSQDGVSEMTQTLAALRDSLAKLYNVKRQLAVDLTDPGRPVALATTAGRLTVAPGQTIASAWGNTVADQSIVCFANAGDRDNQWPIPHEGSVCFLDDSKLIYAFRSGGWTPFGMATGGRYRWQRAADGVANGAYCDIGTPSNTPWSTGSLSGTNSNLTIIKPCHVDLVAAVNANGALIATICGQSYTVGPFTGGGGLYQQAITWSGMMNPGDTMTFTVRALAVVNLRANSTITFQDAVITVAQ